MFSSIKPALARHFELKQLALDAIRRPRPSVPELVRLDRNKATWMVPTSCEQPSFMQARTHEMLDEDFVVMVDGEAFYYTWLKCSPVSPHRRSSGCILRAEMPNNRKYEWAVKGFAGGIENPVPLAECCAQREGRDLRISFINGITRTFWLLVHRAPAFPVSVYGRESAELLNQVVGIETASMSLAKLFQPAMVEQFP